MIDVAVYACKTQPSTSKPLAKSPLSASAIAPLEVPSAASRSKKNKKKTASSTPTPLSSQTLTAHSAPPTIISSASLSSSPDDDGWTKVGRGASELEAPTKGEGTRSVESEEKQTLAEKMLPKPVATAVDECVNLASQCSKPMFLTFLMTSACSHLQHR